MSDVRAGMQTAMGQKAWVKFTPSAARRSRVGVRAAGWPLTPTQSKRC